MSPAVTIGYISYEQTRIQAGEFLKTYHPSLTLPVPIERIIELQLKINVIPLPGLVKDFKSVGAECLGFLSSDLSGIYIDHHIWESHNLLYRSTLAHEIGHMVLHKEYFENRPFNDAASFKSFVSDMQQDGSSLSRFEIQANNFAGLILVPQKKLLEVIEKTAPDFRVRIRTPGLANISEDEAWEFYCEQIAKEFEVSYFVIAKRVELEKLKPSIKLI